MKHIIEPSENISYDDVYETIMNDADKRGLSQDQVWEIWQAGLAAPALAAENERLREALGMAIDYLTTIAHDENHVVLRRLRAALAKAAN